MVSNRSRDFLAYVALIVSLGLAYRLFGFERFDFGLATAFFFGVAGAGVFFFAFGARNKPLVFLGAAFFFFGLFYFLYRKLLFVGFFDALLPALPAVVGFSLLFAYYVEPKKKTLLYVALVCFHTPIFYAVATGRMTIESLIEGTLETFDQLWFYFLAGLLLLFVIGYNEKIREKIEERRVREKRRGPEDMGPDRYIDDL
jgi:hypothetical protein